MNDSPLEIRSFTNTVWTLTTSASSDWINSLTTRLNRWLVQPISENHTFARANVLIHGAIITDHTRDRVPQSIAAKNIDILAL
jgi:hypothetical protein